MKRSPLRRSTIDRGAPRSYGREGCVVDGCDRPHKARGWCLYHYQRWRATGDPLAEPDVGEPQVEFVCGECGDTFRRYASQVRHRGQGRFCSRSCIQAAKLSRRSAKCKACGEVYQRARQLVGRDDAGKFCTRSCYLAWKAAQPRLVVEAACEVCGRNVSRPRAWGAIRFCSRECQGVARQRPGATTHRGTGWRKIAASIRERDGGVCVRCGGDDGSRLLAVDHIVPWISCSTEIGANDPANLASLCLRCHGIKTTVVEPRLLRGDFVALFEFYGRERAEQAMEAAL